jgi:diguanylate cyclase (GGDEF)-like protein
MDDRAEIRGSDRRRSAPARRGPDLQRDLRGRLAGVSILVVILLAAAAGGTIWRYEVALSHSNLALRAQRNMQQTQLAVTFFWRQREAMNEYLLRPSPRLAAEVATNQRAFELAAHDLDAATESEQALLGFALRANADFVQGFTRERLQARGGMRDELRAAAHLNAAEAGVLGPLDALEANYHDEVARRQTAAGAADLQALIASLLGGVLGVVVTAGLALYSRRLLREASQRRQTDRYTAATQREFARALQNSETEQEADELLKRQLERSVANSSVVVLRRNRSDNRLEAATPGAGSKFVERLANAEPRSCLAVRLGDVHEGGGRNAPIMRCSLCASDTGYSTCQPLLVAGEVIGSALVSHPQPLEDTDLVEIANSVGQAGPVLANLRNLALAQFRASTDALTGLPNNRAVQDTLKRMVAQASRAVSPLTAIMLDLDHFKQINDKHGHGRGDDVLAAVGAVLDATLRASDFAGRYGGEEFVILLPQTDRHEGVVVAEKLRAAIEAIVVPEVTRPITASLGLAVLPDDAGDSATLLRHADRLLYTAKANGRNRVEAISDHLKQSADTIPKHDPTPEIATH